MNTEVLKAHIEELEAVASHIPPDLLAQRLLALILDIWQGATSDPLPVDKIQRRLAPWQTQWQDESAEDPGEDPGEESATGIAQPQRRRRGRPPAVRDPDGKKCTKCGKHKPYKDFHNRSDTSDGRSSQCKECRKESQSVVKNRVVPGEKVCAKGVNCVAYDGAFRQPAILSAASTSPLCEKCQRRAGLAS